MTTIGIKLTQCALAACMIATLAACGGDSGEAASASTGPTPTPTPTPKPEDLQTFVPSSYAAGSPGEYMFNYLNDARVKCGFGALRHDVRLDKSAQNHTDWLTLHNQYGHDETPGTAGFTGTSSTARAMYAGYRSQTGGLVTVGEGGGADLNEGPSIYKFFMREQLQGAYHSMGKFRYKRDVGFGISKFSIYGYKAGTLVFANLGALNSLQKIPKNSLNTYPCNGVENLPTFHTDESPNPLAPRNLHANPPGHPIIFMAQDGSKLMDVNVSVVESVSGAIVSMAVVRTIENEKFGSIQPNEAYAIPDSQLKKNTNYRVSVTAKIDGVAVDKSFAFSTGTYDKAAESSRRNE